MTLTLEIYWLIPIVVGLFFIGFGLYERGQRNGMETAEKLYEPLMDAIKERLEMK